jgi:hypothetical protein
VGGPLGGGSARRSIARPPPPQDSTTQKDEEKHSCSRLIKYLKTCEDVDSFQSDKDSCARSVSHALFTTPLFSHESLIPGMCKYGRNNVMTGHTALGHVTR